MADSLARYMKDLGIDRRAKQAPDLTGYLTKQYGGKGDYNGPAEGKPGQPPPPATVAVTSDGDGQAPPPAAEDAS